MSDAPGLSVRLSQRRPIPLDVRLECRPGELLALVGPSGSGKTTVLRCIAGLDTPEHGTVSCNGVTWLDTEIGIRTVPQRRRVGLVFQHYALFPHVSALGNVAIAMTHRPVSERKSAARDLISRVNMEGLEHRRPAELSGGQRQRIALARALARDPAVLLLDEPFSAVDQITRRRLHRELAQLRSDIPIPVILVTHDLDESQLLADRMSVLHRGTTLQTGTTREVMRRPVNAEVARLIDRRNIFTGVLIAHEPVANRSWIEWAGRRLECALVPEIAPGTPIDWLLSESDIVLHRKDRPSRGEHENPVHGTVADLVALGNDVMVTLKVPLSEQPIFFSVSEHVARRNKVTRGEPLGISLLAEGIHVMRRG